MEKVYIVGGGAGGYNRLFLSFGWTVVANIEEATLAVFTGGADVSPDLYGAARHPYTGTDARRDLYERTVFESLKARGVPMVGICRGGQFLNVMSGGEMYQHVEKHTRSHYLVDNITGETVYVSSTHHQMMKPSDKAILVATSNLGGEREWYEGEMFKRDVSQEDIEVVFYEDTRCLCFQPHPEMEAAEYEGMRTYFRSLLQRYIGI